MVNALQLLALVLFVVPLLRQFVPLEWACVGTILLLLLPGFVMPWLRLNLGERGALLWAIVGVWALRRFTLRPSIATFVVLCIAVNLSLYYKEPTFAAFFTLGCIGLVGALAGAPGPRAAAVGYAAIVASSIIFIVVYYLVVWRHLGGGNYADQRRSMSSLANRIFTVRHYVLVAHPLLFAVLLPQACHATP